MIHSVSGSNVLFCNFVVRFKMPENSIPKEAAFQIINDELMLDGNPRLNLASFVTTWMEPECDKLIMSAINKNYVDMDEYPVTTELQVRFFISLFLPLIKAFNSIDFSFLSVDAFFLWKFSSIANSSVRSWRKFWVHIK